MIFLRYTYSYDKYFSVLHPVIPPGWLFVIPPPVLLLREKPAWFYFFYFLGTSCPAGKRGRWAWEEGEGGGSQEEGDGGADGEGPSGARQRLRHGGQDVWLPGDDGLFARPGGTSPRWLWGELKKKDWINNFLWMLEPQRTPCLVTSSHSTARGLFWFVFVRLYHPFSFIQFTAAVDIYPVVTTLKWYTYNWF